MEQTNPARPATMLARQQRGARKSLAQRAMVMLRDLLLGASMVVYRRIFKMDIDPTSRISLKARLDYTNPRGVHIGADSYVAFGAVILAHDMTRLFHTDTYIGRNCFIGANAIVMPGVRIGDECIVGSGAVVTRDVPSHSIVAGNPAVVVRSGIRTARWGVLQDRLEDVQAIEAAERKAEGEG